MVKNWRNSRDWRICKVIVKRRDKVCQICGTRKSREVHHLNSARYFPEQRLDPENCIVLCTVCHRHMFHVMYKGGYRKKTTKEDFNKFKEIVTHYQKS